MLYSFQTARGLSVSAITTHKADYEIDVSYSANLDTFFIEHVSTPRGQVVGQVSLQEVLRSSASQAEQESLSCLGSLSG